MDAFETLYDTYFRDVYHFCQGLTGSKALAEDITQETFMKAMKSIRGFKGDCDVRTWLFQIAKNTYHSYCRKFNRIMPETETDRPDPAPSIEQRLVDSESALQIHHALHELPEPYREVFYLRVFGELSFKQIAQVFGRTDNWACVTYHRAKNAIRKQLEDDP